MINVEIVPKNDHLVFVRFSDPNEEFGNKPFIVVDSIDEAKRRMYFKNRIYITEKLTCWLKQRKHALPDSEREIDMLLGWIHDIHKSGFSYICDFVKRKRLSFESFAPSESSRCYAYYNDTIVPILNFCTDGHA
jgi:hypothetical protein